MTATSHILLRALLALIAALAIAAVTSTAVTAAERQDSALHAFTEGDSDGECFDWEDLSDPDCIPLDDGEADPVDECEWGLECETTDEGEDDGGDEEVIQWPAPPKGAYAKIRSGRRTASIPRGAPKPIRAMIRAANSLVRKPYKWGGGHKRWRDRGYDCSGAVGYVLNAAGYLDSPLSSGGFARYGKQGAGNWVRIYANKKHVFMVIAGLRFDTTAWGASGGKGPRWRDTVRPTGGFKLRHPAGL